MHDEPNASAVTGALVIEALVRRGVRHVVLAPGSRSSPLVAAAVAHPQIETRIHLDERGAAFRALGLGRATGAPAAVITTSGTAVANLLPAAVEAAMDHVPLVLLTADRPPELHDVGANQAIHQHDLFRPFTRASVTLAPVEADTDLEALVETVDRVVAATSAPAGPVQVNVQLREPLAPTAAPWNRDALDALRAWLAAGEPPPRTAAPDAPSFDADAAAAALTRAERPLLVLGSLDGGLPEALALASASGIAVVADLRSGLRGMTGGAWLPHLDEAFALDAVPAPDVIVQLGGRLTSKGLQMLVARGAHETYCLVDPVAPGADPAMHVTAHIRASVADAAAALRQTGVEGRIPSAWAEANARVAAAIASELDAGDVLSEPFVARRIATASTKRGLFVGNSMPIRDVHRFGRPGVVGTNRGASGIDGLVSTALGYAEGLGLPTTLLLGDLSLLHDLNGLSALQAAAVPLTVVVQNNHGGSIFSRLPIAQHDVFSPWFDTPHELGFQGAAAQFGLAYAHCETPGSFVDAYERACTAGRPSLIEVASGLQANADHHERVEAAIRKALA